jgi:hypothetical protein
LIGTLKLMDSQECICHLPLHEGRQHQHLIDFLPGLIHRVAILEMEVGSCPRLRAGGLWLL